MNFVYIKVSEESLHSPQNTTHQLNQESLHPAAGRHSSFTPGKLLYVDSYETKH